MRAFSDDERKHILNSHLEVSPAALDDDMASYLALATCVFARDPGDDFGVSPETGLPSDLPEQLRDLHKRLFKTVL